MSLPPAAEIQDRLYRAQRVLAVALGLVLALGAGLAVLALRPSGKRWLDTQALLEDPAVRRDLARRLATQVAGVWDSHEDPDVCYVSVPQLRDHPAWDVSVSSNRMGLRERDFAMPKPSGMTRVVLLGDSWIFGNGVEGDERAGVFLEAFLKERAAGPGPVEVLNVASPSWNIISECAYLRRQLDLLQPDLVLHVTCPNDLDDTMGVRGMGFRSRFSPQHRERADSMVSSNYPNLAFGTARGSHLTSGLGYESRQRYELARERIDGLIEALDEIGCEYVMVLNWGGATVFARHMLVPKLEEARLAAISTEFRTNPENWVSEANPHWGPSANEKVAMMLYALIRERNLLAGWDLPEWLEADRLMRDVMDVGMEESGSSEVLAMRLAQLDVRSAIDFAAADEEHLRQIDAGIDKDRLVSPYASILLRNLPDATLTIGGRALDRPVLDGTRVEVFADEVKVGEIELQSGAEVRGSWTLPEELNARPYVSVRLIADDYVYSESGGEMRHCVVFRLDSLAIAP